MADPSYLVPGAQIHAFMMYAPFVALWEKRGMLVQGGFLLLTGPVMAAMISPNLMEQASIWCFFSTTQCAVGAASAVLQTRAAAPPTKAGRKAAGPAKSPVRRSSRSPAPRVLLSPAG